MGAHSRVKAFLYLLIFSSFAMACSMVGIMREQDAVAESDSVSGERAGSLAYSLTATREMAEAFPTPTIVPDTGWRYLHDGLEQRIINLMDGERLLFESLYLIRVNPDIYRFDVLYQPGNPLSLAEWMAKTGALIVVNGGFFTEAFEATGIIVSEGSHSGVSYQGFGGMLVVTLDGPELRWLAGQPYDPSEQILAGLQSFPMLIRPGGRDFYSGGDAMRARRTVIAQDRQGRIIFIIATLGGFTLDRLSRFLVQSDLDLDRALNLDGGASSGLKVAGTGQGVDAYSLLPSVITVFPSR